MYYYKNLSCSVKTFHGVSFQPGEIAAVPDFINQKYMIRIDNPKQQKPSSEKPKDAEERSAEKKSPVADAPKNSDAASKKSSTQEAAAENRK